MCRFSKPDTPFVCVKHLLQAITLCIFHLCWHIPCDCNIHYSICVFKLLQIKANFIPYLNQIKYRYFYVCCAFSTSIFSCKINLLICYKSQSNFWLSFQKFLYAGIAYCYRLFRHFSLWKILSNLLISPYVLVFKSSRWSSKFSVYYLGNQPLHFCYRRFGSRMRVIVQRHIDVGMSHDVLQCLWVHSCIC